ncbi:transcription factor E2F/dimerization partner [Dictyocaulus viviparus]|uniref:Transcription factor E2F/dimerization partner n=1 Tax=Dictyocaulus viviparus TaxID=29172 RepID=A0A0D8Y7N7_DICVI|nr:transcription factor E2F/dimerization partner [Dictyocaulus viviparus]
MSQWAAMIEANKENIPYPVDFADQKLIISDNSILSDIDIDSAAPQSVLPSSPLSQKSSLSVQKSMTDSPRICAMTTYSRQESCDDVDVECEDSEITSRKEKSLGLLCQRFLVAMNEETRTSITKEVHLETVARKMNVEKRRIYDIVNVMEALDAMSKTNKSYYKWHGLEGLPKLMADLQKEAVEEHLPERVLRVEQAMCSFTELSPGSRKSGAKEIVGSLMCGDDNHPSSSRSQDAAFLPQSNEKRSRVDVRDRQGRNSLAQLCRRFLMVLLSNPKNTRRVSLDVASTVLIKDPETEGFEPPSRSRCRRLYDIANVLVALGLIKKVHYLFGTKKIPLFVYCGPEPDENSTFDVNACIERLLSSSASTPLTPQMKATTAAMQQSLSVSKRSNSEVNLHVSISNKMPRIKSNNLVPNTTSSLMMFAELAAERLRQETEFRERNASGQLTLTAGTSKTSYGGAMVRLNNEPTLPKPQAQRSFGHFSASPLSSPINGTKRYAVKIGNSYQMSAVPLAGLQSIVLPTAPVWTAATHFPDFMHSSAIGIPPSGPIFSSPTTVTEIPTVQPVKPVMKHTVTNILGASNKINTNQLNHRNSSPFQIVKKENSIA